MIMAFVLCSCRFTSTVVTKNTCKSICLGVQLRLNRHNDNYADYTGGCVISVIIIVPQCVT